MDQELTYRLGESILDLNRGTLRRDGEAVSMRPKTLKFLGYLVRNAGRVVSQDELHAALWPRSVVMEGALVRCVREARQSIGDERHDIIHTVSGRGYLYLPHGSDTGGFAVPVATPEDLACGRGPAEPKIAIMPFTLSGVDETIRPAFDEVVQEIRAAIAHSRAIVIKPVPRRGGAAKAISGADYLVEGQVLGGSSHLNVVVTLSNVKSGRRMLTQTFILKAEGLAAFHQNIARQVVSALVFNIEAASWQATPQGTTSLHVW